VFRSFPLCLRGAGYRQSRATLNGNPKGRTTSKIGFPLPTVIYLAENLSGLKIFCSLSWFPVLIGNYSVFPSIFFISFYFLPIFDRESFFSFSFLSFHFFLSDL